MFPLISVIIPTFNRKNIVNAAIDSVLSQSYPNIELIVVDDGSTDKTVESLLVYKKKINLYRQDNKGASSARNLGVEKSKGEFIAFLDSDDTWHRSKLETQYKILASSGNNVPCCICDTIMNFSDNKISFFESHKLILNYEEGVILNIGEIVWNDFILLVQSVLIKRSFLNIPVFDVNLKIMEDYDLSIKLSKIGPWAYSTKKLVNWYSDSPYSLTSMADKNKIEIYRSIDKIYKNNMVADRFVGKTNIMLIVHLYLNKMRLLSVVARESELIIVRLVGSLLFFISKIANFIFRICGIYKKPITAKIGS